MKIIYFLNNLIKKPGFKKILFLAFIIIFLLSISFNLYLYLKYKKERVMIIRPEEAIIQDPAVEFPAQVSKLMRLPQDEKPEVFVINANTPRNQPFIENAQNGDVLLLYLKNQKAILFNPIKNQITKVGALTFSSISGQLKDSQNNQNEGETEKSSGGRVIINPKEE